MDLESRRWRLPVPLPLHLLDQHQSPQASGEREFRARDHPASTLWQHPQLMQRHTSSE
jgi:hypothetical protein